MADVAFILHAPLADLGAMTPAELFAWHREAARIAASQGMTGGLR